MADHQIPRISFTFDAYSCPVEFALFFIPTPSTRWKVHVTSKGLLGIRASPVSVAGFPQDSDMFPVSRWLISHIQMESAGPKSTRCQRAVRADSDHFTTPCHCLRAEASDRTAAPPDVTISWPTAKVLSHYGSVAV